MSHMKISRWLNNRYFYALKKKYKHCETHINSPTLRTGYQNYLFTFINVNFWSSCNINDLDAAPFFVVAISSYNYWFLDYALFYFYFSIYTQIECIASVFLFSKEIIHFTDAIVHIGIWINWTLLIVGAKNTRTHARSRTMPLFWLGFIIVVLLYY